MSLRDSEPLVLNQYRFGSSYKDSIGLTYHFPSKYLGRFKTLPRQFVYYEPRDGGEQVYFGGGVVGTVCKDTEEDGHYYADLDSYRPFQQPVGFYEGPDGKTWEAWANMRNSVRPITKLVYESLLKAGGLAPIDPEGYVSNSDLHSARAQKTFAELYSGPICPKDPGTLRRIRKVIESYERPSSVSNWVKKTRGDKCQLCGKQGFVKRDGERYCEIHHLFHLAKTPPPDCLRPEYVVVVCATCHRRLHYANVDVPRKTGEGWSVRVDADEIQFSVEWSR